MPQNDIATYSNITYMIIMPLITAWFYVILATPVFIIIFCLIKMPIYMVVGFFVSSQWINDFDKVLTTKEHNIAPNITSIK